MPQYFFFVRDGHNSEIKNEGLNLPDHNAAWVEATSACGELLRELDGKLAPGAQWSMQVRDAFGTDIYLLEFRTKSFLVND